MVILGTSLGGAVGIDFALAHPDAVFKLVLVDAQGFVDGIGPMAKAPTFLNTLGVQVRLHRLLTNHPLSY
jgi:pimeloyl-ACP methyl ester carboxylesterase